MTVLSGRSGYSSSAPAPLGTNATVLGLDGSALQYVATLDRMVGNPRPAPEGGWPTPHDAMLFALTRWG